MKTTVGDLRKWLAEFGDDTTIETVSASAQVLGFELAYEITMNAIRIRPVYNRRAFLISESTH